MENSESRTVIVTGGNRGVGLGIITNLLKNSTRNYKIIMTARKVEDAEKTVQELEESTGKGSCITILQLDLLDDESISGFIEALKKDFTNGVDVLVNNAGIALRTKTDDYLVQTTIGTNFIKTKELTESIVKNNILKENGKIVSVSSSLGKLKRIQEGYPDIHSKLASYDQGDLDEAELLEIVQKAIKELPDEELNKKWGGNVYALSKAFLSIWTYLYSQSKEIQEKGIQVYCCCPGFVDTNMSRGLNAPLTIEEGGITPKYLVELPHVIDDGKQGRFFYESKVTSILG